MRRGWTTLGLLTAWLIGAPICTRAEPPAAPTPGILNAFNEPYSDHLPTCQVSLGYSMIWINGAEFPPLATTGDAANAVPGALGQAGTSILSQESRSPGRASALNGSATWWPASHASASLEASFFLMEQRSNFESFASNGSGSPLLARPFFNLQTQAEDASTRAFPGTFQGTLSDSLTTRMMGAEANVRWHTNPHCDGVNLGFLFGGRWFHLDERYSSFDTTTQVGTRVDEASISDRFTTFNRFVGLQFGLDGQYRLPEIDPKAVLRRYTFGVSAKVAMGPNFQTAKVSGETVRSNFGTGLTTVDPFGLFAQPSNVGAFHTTRFTVMPEVGTKFSVDLGEYVRFNAGYSFFFLHAARPGDQIDRRVNVQAQPGDTGPRPPTLEQSLFRAQMLHLGFEILF